MAEQPAKSKKQQDFDEYKAWLAGAKGEAKIKLSPVNVLKYQQLKKEGKTDAEIIKALEERQKTSNAKAAATRAETAKKKTEAKSAEKAAAKATTQKNNASAAAAKATTKKNNAPAAAAVNGTTAANAGQSKSALANKLMKNDAAKMKAAGIKFLPASYKEYVAARKAGRSNDDIFAELKVKYPFDMVVKRATTKKNNGAAAKANGAAAAKANGAVAAPAKGQWVCEKCRFVSNSNTRKNNKKNNGRTANNFTYGYYE